MTDIIASRYALKGEIGKGSFGIIHVGEHIVTHEAVAIKLQNNHNQSKQLRNESKIYKVLAEKVKEVNQIMPKYKAIRGILISEEPLLKTTTSKIKRQANLEVIDKENNK